MPTALDSRQVVNRSALSFVGNAANEALSVLLPRVDAEIAKLFEDRNVLLTDGGTITFTGTQAQFTENLKITLNQKISGAVPQVISLGSATQTFTNSGDMWVAVIDRTAGTATSSIITNGSALPAVVAANQEVFLIAKRVDAGDGTQRLYWRNGFAQNAGQTLRLGQGGGSGSGSGTGDDLDSLLYRASFLDTFQENAANTNSSINGTSATNATYNAAKNMYAISYDASKTVTGSTVNMTVSGAPAFTVAIGDLLIVGSEARKITTVTSQTVYVIESAFTVTPSPSAAACTVSQGVYTKDIYNLAVDGAAISAGFPGLTFSDIMVDYKDNATVGSNLFTPDVTPVIAYTATNDNTNFTLIAARQTNITDQFLDTVLPSSGSNLFVRFFANKSSGSGTVNLLTYKVFMQKSTIATAGGIANSSYAFTNGVGTPVNATLSVVGGKTTITLPWQYAVGVYSGTSASSIEVWLNGQKLPRFINSTLTPDGSFLETSSTVVTLDRDYSSVNLSIEIFQRTQIVDNSTINTSAISYQQEIMQNGFQSFVAQNQLINATTSAGAPVAGSFYSSIPNRTSIVDLTQDMRVRMGIERFMVQSIYQLQNEFGSNGENVWTTPNDLFGQFRAVGSWGVSGTSSGSGIVSSLSTDFVEVTFYGTGLNLLTNVYTTTLDARASVDGGSEGSNLIPAGSALLSGRNYSPNDVLVVTSGLTLGVHTVKIRNNNASANMVLLGFEVLTEATTLKVNPGVSYANGQKLTLSAIQSPAFGSTFDSGSLGTRGGRVVVYQKSDGTIGKAVTSAGSQLNLTSADHTNEEVVRVHGFREFGSNRSADDFSGANTGTSADRAFTLDDGTTTLIMNQARTDNTTTTEAVFPVSSGNIFTITFVGTGLDIFVQVAGTQSSTVTVDGTNTSTTYVATFGNNKIVSGLAYGTHTIKFTRNGASAYFTWSKITVYQPKKPALPTGATELADYNVMATYVANTTASSDTIGAGVLRKYPTREFTYLDGTGGTTSWNFAFTSATTGFYQANTDRVNAYMQYTFFGTGFDFRFDAGSNRSGNISVAINGLSATTGNFPTMSASVYGTGVTFSAGTLDQLDPSGQNGSGLSISNLPLGIYTVRFTNNSASAFMIANAFDIITPIHSVKSNLYADLQNTLPVGSQYLSDNRKVTPVKDALPSGKAWTKAVGIASAPTTTSTTAVPMPDMSCAIKTSGGPLKISFNASLLCAASNEAIFQAYVDGVAVDAVSRSSTSGASESNTALSAKIQVAAGVHKVDIYWTTTGGTLSAVTTSRFLLVEET